MEKATFSCSSFECIQSFIQMTVVMEKNVCPCSSSSLIQTRQLPAFAEKMLPRLSSAHNKAYHTHTHTHKILSFPCIILDLADHNNCCNSTPSTKQAVLELQESLWVCMLVKPSIFYVSYIGKVGSIYTSL